jgi:hypothetical protein
MANEAFIYSAVPSLAVWPVELMEPGAGCGVRLGACMHACGSSQCVLRGGMALHGAA